MATSPRPFQNDFRKNAGRSNLFVAPKVMIREKEISKAREDNLIDWITYYRRNIHRFVQHYFGIKLHLYQIIWLYFMSISDTFVTIASRASAKSWLIALFAMARAVLYPGSKVVIVATTMKQAMIILGKIKELKDEHLNIAREISYFPRTVTANNCYCSLHNTSSIKVVACDESGRGERANFIIAEEFRIMDKVKYDAIVKPFAVVRQVPYTVFSEYSHLVEEPKEMLISSAYHKGLWWYDETIKTIKMMLNGINVGFIAFDYLVTIKHGIKTTKQIIKERATMDEITAMMEYENIPFGESSNAYFKLDMFSKNRRIKKAFYPLRYDLLDKTKNPYNIKRVDGEVRLVSVDIATRKGTKNDNTIINCIRLIPTAKGYEREYVYSESHHGEHTGKQALRIKQIYHDFTADYIVLDLQQSGIAVFEQLAVVTKDEERGIEYDAYTVYEHKSLKKDLIDELREKTLGVKAKPIIYPILATAELNSKIAVDFRDKLQKKMISFLVKDNDAENYLAKNNKEFSKTDDVNLRNWFLLPYIETELLVNETIATSYSIVSGNIKIETVGTARKDRYTSCSYGSYFATLLERDLLRPKKSGFDIRELVNFKQPITRKI